MNHILREYFIMKTKSVPTPDFMDFGQNRPHHTVSYKDYVRGKKNEESDNFISFKEGHRVDVYRKVAKREVLPTNFFSFSEAEKSL